MSVTYGMTVIDGNLAENQISSAILGCALEVYRALGPGLLESVYQRCMEIALANRGLSFEKEKSIPLTFQSTIIPDAYRLDLLVEDKVIVELKSVQTLLPVFSSQLFTYLKITGLRLGLVINFNTPSFSEGIHQVVNKLL